MTFDLGFAFNPDWRVEDLLGQVAHIRDVREKRVVVCEPEVEMAVVAAIDQLNSPFDVEVKPNRYCPEGQMFILNPGIVDELLWADPA